METQMFIQRPFWKERLEKAWGEKNVVWLTGLRRVGKTSLCKSLDDVEYFDLELTSIRSDIEANPEQFLEMKRGKRIILDEIHRLANPSEILKIAADHYPEVRIIATGSSTFGASAKFRDTLTGRKKIVWLTPLLLEEMDLFNNREIDHRFLFGGFPSFFTEQEQPAEEFLDWMEAYWAKDIEKMFAVEKRDSFLKFAELLLTQSGGQFEATRFAEACEVSRETIKNYLAILKETFIVEIIRPYSTHKATEIVSAPKVYGFDTGFVCSAKGWHTLRPADRGILWEHCVLNEINAKVPSTRRAVNYWRDRHGHEIDFVIYDRFQKTLTAIECKFSSLNSKTNEIGRNFAALRKFYPNGENLVVTQDITTRASTRKYEDLTIECISPSMLIEKLNKPRE
jgi:hypothetical protein